MTRISVSSPLSKLSRRSLLKLTGFGAAALAASRASGVFTPDIAQANDPTPFDMNSGFAPLEVIIPTIIPQIFQRVSPAAMDATLVLRITTLVTNAWFDAIAPYHPTAVGVYSSIARQPQSEATLYNKNVATAHASYRVLLNVLPSATDVWRDMMLGMGLDPYDNQQDQNNPVGIGNLAGSNVAAARENDGMNQLGNEGGVIYNGKRFADYTGYQPVNSAYHLNDPGRWQPDIVSLDEGLFLVQQHVTPQMRLTDTYTNLDLNSFNTPRPKNSKPGPPRYKQQVDEVLAASANMTDVQKMTAELYDNKLLSLGFVSLFIAQSRNMTFDEFVQYDFLVNLAAFDTAVVVWQEKLKWDAVRPFSAVRHVYGDAPVTAWGGPGKGTVSDIPASQWRPYLQTADHSEYPSGSAAFCAAHAEASRLFLDDDYLGWTVPQAAGSSRIEPGVTPEQDLSLHWDSWTDFEHDCGLSRFWAGVHFMPSIDSARPLGTRVGEKAFEFVQAHIKP